MSRDNANPGAPLSTRARTSQPETQRDLLRGLHRLPLPMPRTARELFQLLALYEPSEGLAALFDRVDMSNVQPHHIYRLVHGRAPEGIEQGMRAGDYDPRLHLAAALLSPEFRSNILGALLRAFPEKRRDVFIHIPKCAGTDLVLNLGPGRLSIPKMLEDQHWVDDAELLETLRAIARAVPYYDTWFVFGHMLLGDYLNAAFVSSQDRIFTVLRDPLEVMISQANYNITRLRQDPTGKAPDTKEILGALGLAALPEAPSLEDLRKLAIGILRCPELSPPDPLCFYLGNAGEPTYEAAMRNLVIYDVEVSTTHHYADWLAKRWELPSQTQHNLSEHWLSVEDIDDETMTLLRRRSAAGQRLFDVILRLINDAGGSSITGSQIAAAAGSELFAPVSLAIASGRRSLSPGSLNWRRLGVATAEGERAMASLAARTEGVAPVMSVVFGTHGDLARHANEGWARSEEGFTWTAAATARLVLPKPTRPGDYRLRLSLSPFVVRDKLPAQRIITAANGVVLAEVALTQRGIIECELPAAVLGGGARISLTFTLPDAIQPSEIAGQRDQRLLGAAFRRIDLFHCDDLQHHQSVMDATAHPPVPAPPEPPVHRLEATRSMKFQAPVQELSQSESLAGELEELMMRFESLGENCEFGLVQRRCGAEPLGLFRFASTPLPKLTAVLAAGFEGFATSDNLVVELSDNGREYMIADRRFGLRYHAWVLAGEISPEDLHEREVRRLPLLTRKLIADLELGEKIFVYHGMSALTLEEARGLHAALRRYGPGTLLWIELADADHPAGSVEQPTPGLLKGYMDRLAPSENAHDLSLDCWIKVCRQAWMLHCARADEASNPSTEAPLVVEA